MIMEYWLYSYVKGNVDIRLNTSSNSDNWSTKANQWSKCMFSDKSFTLNTDQYEILQFGGIKFLMRKVLQKDIPVIREDMVINFDRYMKELPVRVIY